MKVLLDYSLPCWIDYCVLQPEQRSFYQLLTWLILLVKISHEKFLIASSIFIKTFDFKKDFSKRNACDKILLNLFSYLS